MFLGVNPQSFVEKLLNLSLLPLVDAFSTVLPNDWTHVNPETYSQNPKNLKNNFEEIWAGFTESMFGSNTKDRKNT
jgi:hypothetical protein